MKVSTIRFVLLAAVVAVTGACATMQAGGTSITGCLNTGAAGYYVITDEQTKQTFTVTGPGLAPHLSHRVTVTGTMTKEQDKEVLKASMVQHLATGCL